MKKIIFGLTLFLAGIIGVISIYITTGMRSIGGSFAHYYVTDFPDTIVGIIIFSLIAISGILIASWEVFEISKYLVKKRP